MYQNINKIYHAAIYVRLSKEDGDISSSAKLESNSISNQKALILDFLKDKKDIEVVSVRVDDGYSGSNFERPAFQAMLEDIRRGIVDCVVVKDLSRFGREYIDSGKYIERLFPALGVRFIAINDNIDTLNESAGDDLTVALGDLGQHVRLIAAERGLALLGKDVGDIMPGAAFNFSVQIHKFLVKALCQRRADGGFSAARHPDEN